MAVKTTKIFSTLKLSPSIDPIINNVNDITTDYHVSINDTIIRIKTPFIKVYLPENSINYKGLTFIIDNNSTGPIQVLSDSGQLIQGKKSQTLHSDESMQLYSDGLNWRII
jgi:hypothetical protein